MYIADELRHKFTETNLFDEISHLEGEVFREVKDRRTFRFVLGQSAYFAKLHYGVGWSEIFKNLIQLKKPVLGAANEWLAIKKLQELNVTTLTPVAYLSIGLNPASIRSVIVTKALDETMSLEELVSNNQLTPRLRRRLVMRVGEVARRLHDNGVNHRDFYICHFLIPNKAVGEEDASCLHLIDLHRAQIRTGSAPLRWREKDIAGLLFSAADAGLSQRDLLRFVRQYHGSLKTIRQDPIFWRAVVKRADLLYQKDFAKRSRFLQDLVKRL